MTTYHIGSLIFKSKIDCHRYTKNIINSLGCCIIDKEHASYEFFAELLKNHSEYDEKIGCGIDYFEIIKNKMNPKFYGMLLHRIDGTVVNFSWVHACEFKNRTYEWYLSAAMRSAIADFIISFKRCSVHKCCICNVEDPNIDFHVDHIYPFSKLKSDFLAITKYPNPIRFTSCEKYGSCIMTDDDIDFKNDWIKFHNDHCKLQILCKTCNIKKSDTLVNE